MLAPARRRGARHRCGARRIVAEANRRAELHLALASRPARSRRWIRGRCGALGAAAELGQHDRQILQLVTDLARMDELAARTPQAAPVARHAPGVGLLDE